MIPQSTLPTINYSTKTSNETNVMWGTDEEESKSKTNFDVSSLGKDDFLTLLIAQLRNQDPLNPADNTEFVAQLAQFSTLEQMTLMNTNLEQSLANNTAMSEAVTNAMVVNYFGKEVAAETDLFTYDGEAGVDLNFNLDRPVSWAKLEITDMAGHFIRTISLGSMEEGINSVGWDGLTNLGVKAQPGEYTYSIEAYDYLENQVGFSQIFYGVVEGITYKDGMAYLNVGGVNVPFDKIRTITDSE